MNITINGDVYITNYGQTLDELTEGIEYYDFDDEECNDECEFCTCDCEEDPIEALIEDYVELLIDDCTCFECSKDFLECFLLDAFSILIE